MDPSPPRSRKELISKSAPRKLISPAHFQASTIDLLRSFPIPSLTTTSCFYHRRLFHRFFTHLQYPYLFDHSSLQSHLIILFSPIPHSFCLVHVKTNILGPSHRLYTFSTFSPSIHSFVVLHHFVETIVCIFLSALASVWSTTYISWEFN
jgi:hypothetical protein